MKVLALKSSILGDFSVSNLLVNEMIQQIKSKHPSVEVIEKDLGINPPAHLSLPVVTSIRTKDVTSLTEQQKQEYQDILTNIQDLKDADMVLIGSPMYNLSVSGGLKAWIDQICQAGLTFKYTEQGPQGLVNDKPVIIASSRGGIYSEGPAVAFDHQEPYLKAVLGLVGISNVTIIRAEGTNINEEMKQNAITQAKIAIKQL